MEAHTPDSSAWRIRRGQHGLHGEQLFQLEQRRFCELPRLSVADEDGRSG